MNLAPVMDLLRQRIGLEPDSLGATTLSRAVRARMRALGLTTGEDYAARLVGDWEQFQLLLADVAVPETWFFRGGQVFAHLAERVAEVVRQRERENAYRILSVPCSTGEEPYSLAIALAEAGASAAAWEIDAVDVCSRHLEVARRARFGKFSFRQTPSMLRDRYFHPVEGGWELDARICSRVRFRQGNLADPLFLAGEASFDLILCRNLFIYLTPDARRQALNTIVRLLAADGWLCMGHADPFDFQDSRFMRVGPGAYFLYCRVAGPAKQPPTVLESPESRSAERGARSARQPALRAARFVLPASPVDFLDRARQQADGGRLAEALLSCQEQLACVGPSADLYSLMGVIHQARQEEEEAVRCYHRALYLEPEHAEALRHLMLLSQERGDGVQAERLRRRLERVAPGGKL
jgi:chemotaxis protein methyltransferase WspC